MAWRRLFCWALSMWRGGAGRPRFAFRRGAADPKAVAGVGGLALVVALAIPLAIKWEGDNGRVGYRDLTGIPTYCYGGTGPKAVVGKRYTQAECDAQLAEDLTKHGAAVHRCLTRAVPPKMEASFAKFDMNTGGFCGSSINRRANAGDLAGACRAMNTGDDGRPRWSFVKDGRAPDGNWRYKFVQGLANVRADERRLCEEGVAEAANDNATQKSKAAA